MSTFAIGDIHGHSELLDRLIDKLPIAASGSLVFLGDIIDRGPDSKAVVERIMALRKEMGERCVCLMGNHEDMLLDHIRITRAPWDPAYGSIPGFETASQYGPGFWLSNGGNTTLASYGGEIPLEHIAFLAGLPLTFEDEKFVYVHAGLRSRGATSRSEMLWGAPGFWSDFDILTGRIILGAPRSFAKTVVVGHTVFERPHVSPDIIGIDTGAGHGGPLTAVQLPEMSFWQVSPIGPVRQFKV